MCIQADSTCSVHYELEKELYAVFSSSVNLPRCPATLQLTHEYQKIMFYNVSVSRIAPYSHPLIVVLPQFHHHILASGTRCTQATRRRKLRRPCRLIPLRNLSLLEG